MHDDRRGWHQFTFPHAARHPRKLMLSLIGTVSLLSAVIWGSFALAGSQDPRAATDQETNELTSIFRKYERIFFNAMVSGDAEELPNILYNDPTVELRPHLVELSERYYDQVNDTLRSAEDDAPIGDTSGFLSAQIAYIANMNYGIEAWEQEQAQARAEERSASPVNLPPGATPFQRPDATAWISDIPVQLVNAKVGGNHATADIVFVEEEQLAEYLEQSDPYTQHYTFTKVDGQWFISNLWSEGTP